jgi:cellulose synthase/poly-beta-1,6-N-acetylglucosamine synthase-like glycosyltransferase
MIYYRSGLNQIYHPKKVHTYSSTFVTIVVCFRNEERYLPALLKSLIAQDFPPNQFEIILYNDASSDGSLAIIKNFEAQYKKHRIICKDAPILPGANSSKKLALIDAAAQSESSLILVTDADCIMSSHWISLMVQCYVEQKALLIAAPVAITNQKTWLNKLQKIEFQALTAVTAGAIGCKKAIMCNGANLGFDRKTFLALAPYQNNLHLSSGDDMFLLMAMQQEFKEKITFLAHQDAVIYTHAKENLNAYLNQRIRWASKSKSYEQIIVKIVALLVLNINVLILLLPLIILFGNLLIGVQLTLLMLVTKQIAEMLILSKFNKIIKTKVNYLNLFLFQWLEALLTLIIAVKSVKGTYYWKDRKQHF